MNRSWFISLLYHDYFDYPLTKEELIKWQANPKLLVTHYPLRITHKNKYIFLNNREKLAKLRQKREKISHQKLKIAHRAIHFLKFIPTVKMVGITGSLAMNNCHEKSDIDFMIVTKKETLWLTRFFTLLFLKFMRIPLRSRGDHDEKDKLCLNIWMDESDLIIHNQNLYTAHELSQIVPLLNRGKTYERLLSQNKWIVNFWPNAVKLPSTKLPPTNLNTFFIILLRPIELFSFKIQWHHMKNSITNETVTSTRAFFHPINWSTKLELHLKKYNIAY